MFQNVIVTVVDVDNIHISRKMKPSCVLIPLAMIQL